MVCKHCGYTPGPEDKLDRCPMCDERWADEGGKPESEASGSDSWRQHSGMYITAGLVAVGIILMLVLLLGGRSGGSGGAGPAAAGSAGVGASTTLASAGAAAVQGYGNYTDSTFGYSFTYPLEWQVLQGVSGQGKAGAVSAGSVSVVDAAGSVAGADHVDLMHVSVYGLTAVVDASKLAEVRPEVEAVLADLQSQSSDSKVVEALAETTAAGMPGFKVTLSFTVEGVPVTTLMYFLFSGDLEYQLTLQAATGDWEMKLPALEAIVASFEPGASSPTTTSVGP